MGKGKRNEKEREGKGEKEKERRNEQERRAGTKGWMEGLYTNSYAIAQCWSGGNTVVTHRPHSPECRYSSLFTFKVLLFRSNHNLSSNIR